MIKGKVKWLWAVIGGVACYALTLLLLTAITLNTEDPAAHIGILSVIPWVLGAAVCGILTGILQKGEKPLLSAAATGGVFLGILALLSLILQDGSPFKKLPLFLLQAAVILAVSILGALPFRQGRNRGNRAVRHRASQMRRHYS